MTDDDFELLVIERDAGVVFATIDAPPINVMTPALFRELAKFSVHVADDDSVRVVVLRSDNPDFFIAHFDVTAILGYPTDGPAERPTEHVGFHAMCETYRTMPKATIVEIGGRVGGGGSELSMSCDMRVGALDRTVINQMEVPIGILPGGTGTQRLPRLVGRGRAMERVRTMLGRLTQVSGGHSFAIERIDDLDDALTYIRDDLRDQYFLGYRPADAALDGTWRRIEVRTSDRRHVVRAREGYLAAPRY